MKKSSRPTVAQMIAWLQTLPQDALVVVPKDCGEFVDYGPADLDSSFVGEISYSNQKVVYIEVK